MKKNNAVKNVLKITMTGLLAALACVATMIVQIKIPATGGYVNLGDCIVIFSAWALGPVYGGLAGGIGSCMADIISGYAFYAPATFVIKFLMAFAAGLLFTAFKKKLNLNIIPTTVIIGIVAELIMITGYFAFEAITEGTAAAIGGLIGNAVQGIAGIITSTVLVSAVEQTKVLSKLHIKEG